MHQNTLFLPVVALWHRLISSACTSPWQEKVVRTCNPNQTTSSKGFTPHSPGDHTFQGLCPTALRLTCIFTPTPSHPTNPRNLTTLPASFAFLPCTQKGLTATTKEPRKPLI